MLDPSSSEEEGDEILAVEQKEVSAPKSLGGDRLSPGRAADGYISIGCGGLEPWGRGSGGGRPSSPCPSVGSDKEKEDVEKMQRVEEEKKRRLQLYVFVMRCIAYPFNAKQPTDMARRQQKVRADRKTPRKLQSYISKPCIIGYRGYITPTVASTFAPCRLMLFFSLKNITPFDQPFA